MNVAQLAGFLGTLEHPAGEFIGQPFLLEPWQYEFLSDALELDEAGRPRWSTVALCLPRGCGKTSLLAGVSLYRLIFDEDNPTILLAAASDRQAGRLFDACEGFTLRAPHLLDRLAIQGYKGLIYRKDGGGRIQRLASNPATAHGYRPSLVVVDELARWTAPSLRQTWAALTSGGVARTRPQVFAISTAGAAHERDEGILGRLLDENEHAGEVQTRGALTIARNHAAATLTYNYSAVDVDDLAAVKEANPASWVTLEYLAAQAAAPELSASEFAQLHAGVWRERDETWITAPAWDAAERPRALQPGERIAVGFDGSRYRDATALVGCSIEGGHLQLLALWERPRELPRSADWTVPGGEVDRAVADACARYRVLRLYADPALWQSEVDGWALRHRRVAVLKFPAGRPSRMGSALERFKVDLLEGAISHSNDPALRRHVLAARRRETRGEAGNAQLQKPGRSEYDHIDAAVAAVLAYEARADALAAGEGRGKAFVFY